MPASARHTALPDCPVKSCKPPFIEVRGRGGTVLRPAVTRLEESDDFPKAAPILVITDGECDVFQVRREHAFLMPSGARLPFRASGPVFHFEAE